MLTTLLWMSAAWAWEPAHLAEGTPEFESCLSNPSCEESFYAFLGHSMVEQGFTFQGQAQLGSALVQPQDGPFAAISAATFPFSPPRENLSGKEENTSYSPVIPRLQGGWVGPVAENVRFGAFGAFFPPIAVGGASAFVLEAGASVAWQPSELFRLGAELDLTWTEANAPIVASEEQYEARDDFDNPSNLDPETYEEVCIPAGGCVDTFTLLNPSLLLGATVLPRPWLTITAKLGAAYVNESLWVMYDDTLWRLGGLQPSAHLDVGLQIPGTGLTGALGAATAYRPPAWSEETGGALFRLNGSIGWVF